MINISDFIAFAKTQGYNIDYRAKIGESVIFDIQKTIPNRLSTRYDDVNNNIIWFSKDYDISESDLENLVKQYNEGINFEGTDKV